MSECKPREVIPDSIEVIRKCREVVDNMRKHNTTLRESIEGPSETEKKDSPAAPEPSENNSIKFLEYKMHQLLEELMEVEEKYRISLNLLLGGAE